MEEDKDMSGINTYDVGIAAGLRGIGGLGGYGYDHGYGKAAEVAYTAFQHNDTRHDVRREGDQSANRDAFANVQTVLQGNRQENMFFASHLDSDRKFEALSEKINNSMLENVKCCHATQMLVSDKACETQKQLLEMEIQRLNHHNSCLNVALSASTNRSVFIGGDATTSNNSGQQN